jgi:hypothetical protein
MPNDMAIAPFARTDGHGKSDIPASDNRAYFRFNRSNRIGLPIDVAGTNGRALITFMQ